MTGLSALVLAHSSGIGVEIEKRKVPVRFCKFTGTYTG